MANATTLDLREIAALLALDDPDSRLSQEIDDDIVQEWKRDCMGEFMEGQETADPGDIWG